MGTINTAVASLMGWSNGSTKRSQLAMLDKPLFSQFGKDIFASDIVKTAVHRIAEEISKCIVKSVVQKDKTQVNNDEINALFTSRVNPLMTSKDFLYKIAYLAVKNCNCFIYPSYDEVPLSENKVKRVYKGFYPLEAQAVKLYYNGEEMRLELIGKDGTTFDFPYEDIIHIRMKYGENQYLGGDSTGKLDVRGLLGNLQIMKVIKEAIPKSMEASLSLKGILTMRTVADFDKKEISREEFEKHLFKSEIGIAATDYEADFQPININATDLPKGIMEFLHQEILYPFGVSIPILNGKWTDDEYTSFYQTVLEGIVLSIEQAFTAVIYTDRQRANGYRIKVYDRRVQNLSMPRRIDIVKMVNPSALLNRDEQRELLGYEPDGEATRVSLNFVDINIANQYQLMTINQNKTQQKEDD